MTEEQFQEWSKDKCCTCNQWEDNSKPKAGVKPDYSKAVCMGKCTSSLVFGKHTGGIVVCSDDKLPIFMASSFGCVFHGMELEVVSTNPGGMTYKAKVIDSE